MDENSGDLNLGHVFAAAGADSPADVLVLRHTFTPDGLPDRSAVTPENVLAYTRRQWARKGDKVGATPPSTWLVFIADGGRRSRFYGGYQNRGEVQAERTSDFRYFDLCPTTLMGSLSNRLVVEWSTDTINWAKTGTSASRFPVVEIADPEVVEFPGFDQLLLTYGELHAVVEDSRYARWRTALASVQGVYLIADTTTGHLYVGKADGQERILGRWSAYARDGHGGNKALRELAGRDASHAHNFVFSILRVFAPSTPVSEVDAAEAHFKRALLTRQYGLNRN